MTVSTSHGRRATPNLFLVGAAKCGTTAMASYLGQHPEIFFSDPKEPLFFGRDLYHTWRLEDFDAYLDLFTGAREARWIGEGTAWYLYSRRAAEEIKSFRSEEHTSELQSLMRISYSVLCLNKKTNNNITCTYK